MADSHREEIAKLEALYAGNPGGRVFVHLADAYRKAGEHERARRILDEGLARHPDSASGYVVLGRVLADMQIVDEAAVAFGRVLALDGGNLVALRWLGDLSRQAGRNEEAIAHYRELLARNPSNEEVRDLVEIVEREAGLAGPTDGVDGQDAADETFSWQEPDPDEAFEVAGSDLPEAAEQVGILPDSELSPLSAAPGQTGDGEAADLEFGLVEINALSDDEGDTEAPAAGEDAAPMESVAPAEPMGWSAAASSDTPDTGDPVLVDSSDAELDDALMQLNETVRNDEASPLELHLLDPSYAGEGEGDEVDIDLTFDDSSQPEEDFADDEFIADLISAGTAAPDEGDDMLDVLDADTLLTLPEDAEASGTDEPAAEAAPLEFAGTPSDYEAPAAIEAWSAPTDTDLDRVDAVDQMPQDSDAAGDEAPETMVKAGSSASTDEPEPEWSAAEPGGYAEVGELDPATTRQQGLLDQMDSFASDFADDAGGDDAGVNGDEPLSAAAAQEPAAASTEPLPAAESANAETQAKGAVEAGHAETGPLTETMAELYRAQGFHERAADVYRALLRHRPFDLRLSAKLSETEADAAAAESARSAAMAAAPEDEATGEVWLRGVGAPWDAGQQAAADSVSPYGWVPEPEDAAAGEPIGAYLRDLVSWKTAGRRWAEPDTPPAPSAPQTASWTSAEEPWVTPDLPADWGTSGDAAVIDPWGERTPAAPEPEPADPTHADAAEPAATGADVDTTPSPTPEPADPWLQGGTERPESTWSGVAAQGPDTAPTGETWAPAGPPAESGAAAAGGEGSSDEEKEDEDLEMFRSWLQSLKK